MRKVHFIGICGKGMSAVAKLLIDTGITVTGSDEGFYPPVSTYIEKNNIPFIKGYKRENIATDVDTVVISKHAKLVPEECDEVKYAFELKEQGKIEIKSFPEVLQELTKERENLVVVGSFGKSTCTSLLAHVLEYNKLDIGYFIGATPITPALNAHVGTHKNFVLEGDEYPSANWDMASKFMYYNAHDILLTALVHDHINIFKTHNEFKRPFFELIKKMPIEGKLVISMDDETIKLELNNILKLHKNAVTYSTENENANYFVKNINYGEFTTFDICFTTEDGPQLLGNIETKLLGIHNIQNILGVTALVLEKKLLNFAQTREAVKKFEAVEGRLNEIKNSSKVKIFEGFGSSVDKAESAIDAIKLHFPNKNLKIIFEPYTFSWRDKEAIHWYDKVFLKAKKVYVYEPPTHGANTINQSSQAEIVERIIKSGIEAESIVDHESAVDKIISELDYENDIVLTLSPSDFGGLILKLVEKI
jgi:UDP-N-acetylmuramate: L-alanyl-gamma-D-glutamyl-meso-diaminopimelate ligase